MHDLKYQTIDPLILQTLNLNERRMNHILNIIHGRPANFFPESAKVKLHKNHFQNSLREDKKSPKNSFVLPEISKRNFTIETDRVTQPLQPKHSTREVKSLPRKPRLKKQELMQSSVKLSQTINPEPSVQPTENTMKKHKNERRKALNEPATPISLLQFQKIEQMKESSTNSKPLPRNSLSAVKNKLISNKISHLESASMRELSPSKQVQRIQGSQLLPRPSYKEKQQKKGYLYGEKKTKQMLNDYMGEYTLKKSKSMQVLNPKDIYRFEIQNIIAEPTQIEKLQDAQKKMKRIKKRHQHLKHFDQKYYSKLIEMDLVTL